jgi:hypothetical protein
MNVVRAFIYLHTTPTPFMQCPYVCAIWCRTSLHL